MPNHHAEKLKKALDLANNPKVAKSVVLQYQKVEKELQKLGVDTRPHYTLSPPLGNLTKQPFSKSK